MPTLELTSDQVVELVKQLSPEQKRQALLSLAVDADASRMNRMALADTQLRKIAAERALDWDTMTDDERQMLVDDLIHEDRK